MRELRDRLIKTADEIDRLVEVVSNMIEVAWEDEIEKFEEELRQLARGRFGNFRAALSVLYSRELGRDDRWNGTEGSTCSA
jgi:hypothetical protein